MLQIAQEIVYFAHINSNHIMKIINFAETNSILNQYVAEIFSVRKVKTAVSLFWNFNVLLLLLFRGPTKLVASMLRYRAVVGPVNGI